MSEGAPSIPDESGRAAPESFNQLEVVAALNKQVDSLTKAVNTLLEERDETSEKLKGLKHVVRVYANTQEEPLIPKVARWDKESKIKLARDWEVYLSECRDRRREAASITQALPKEVAERIVWVELGGDRSVLTQSYIISAIAAARNFNTKTNEHGFFSKLKKNLRWDSNPHKR